MGLGAFYKSTRACFNNSNTYLPVRVYFFTGILHIGLNFSNAVLSEVGLFVSAGSKQIGTLLNNIGIALSALLTNFLNSKVIDGSFLKTFGIAMVYSLKLQHALSAIRSSIVIICFVNMLELTVVVKKHKARWRLFVKSWIKRTRKLDSDKYRTLLLDYDY